MKRGLEMSNERITVSAKALRELVSAAVGSPHHVRELQATRGLPGFDNCIDVLQREFNEWVGTEPKEDYQALYEAKCDELATLRALSVTKIMLDVTPGHDGMGHEVYATCVDDVVNALSKQGERIEELEIEVSHWREAGNV
jgi:hypothetical protein